MAQTAATVTGPTPAECYYVRVPEWMTWGMFFLHPNFVIACHTDYGTYSYGWHCGENPTMEKFKRELLRFNTQYVMGKFARRETLDTEATRKRFVELILRLRKAKKIDTDRARELYEQAQEYEGDGLVYWAFDQSEFSGYDICEYPVYDYSPEAKGFFEHLWPLFTERLRAELAAEAAIGPVSEV